jgi:hypothetical protein
MHPRSRTGVRLVLASPSDPSRLNEFSDWYDTYSAAITVPGYLANEVHFENPDASGERNSPRHATIYDIVSPDPATAWPDTEHSPAYPAHLFSDPRAKRGGELSHRFCWMAVRTLGSARFEPAGPVHVLQACRDTLEHVALGRPEP